MRKIMLLLAVILIVASCKAPVTNDPPDSKTANIEMDSFDQVFYESEVGPWYQQERGTIIDGYNATISSLWDLLNAGAITASQYDQRVVAANSARDAALVELDVRKYAEDHYGYANVSYRVENKSAISIDSVKTYFRVTTTDGSKFVDSDFEYDIPAGTTRSGSALISTSKKKASTVEIYDYSIE